MKKITALFLCGLFLCWAGTVFADYGDSALGAKAGTLGLGAEATIGITPSVNARLEINGFPYHYSRAVDNVNYNFYLKLFSGGVLFDWHPLEDNFRMSIGGLADINGVEAKPKPAAFYKIGSHTYTAGQVGSLEADVTVNSVAPYFGIGYGNAVGEDKRFGFSFDLGVIYQNTPNVKYTVNGPVTNTASFLNDLNSQRNAMSDALGYLEWYPVISVGFSYKF
jgi:hypothetical protein